MTALLVRMLLWAASWVATLGLSVIAVLDVLDGHGRVDRPAHPGESPS